LGFFEKIRQGLAKTKKNVTAQLNGMFASFTGANEEFFEELEETLILADLGVETSMEAVDRLREITRKEGYRRGEDIKNALTEILVDMMPETEKGLKLETKPSVILVIGVNGVGKTTTIGKLAGRYAAEGKKVLLAAGDTFPPQLRSSSPCGLSAPARTSSGMRRAPIPPPLCLTGSPPPGPGGRTSSSAIRRAGSTTSRI
jgi:fused signal recognition particle receptor